MGYACKRRARQHSVIDMPMSIASHSIYTIRASSPSKSREAAVVEESRLKLGLGVSSNGA